MSSGTRELRHRASEGNKDGRRKQQHAGGKKGPIGSAQKKHTSKRDRIRLLEHLLKKENLPDNARAKAQHELDQLHAAQQESKRIEKEKKLATRYHKIKFFERVKIERAIAKLQRQQAADGTGLSAQQQQELHQLQQDLLYVRHFPPGEKYVSLLKKADSPEVQEKLDAERQRLRSLVEKRLQAVAQAAADKAALTEADEGRQKAVGDIGNGTAASNSNKVAALAAVVDATVEEGGNDDFFMSEEEDSEELHDQSQLLAAKHAQRKQPVVARAWPKPAKTDDVSSDDLSEDGFQDEGDDASLQDADATAHDVGVKRPAGRSLNGTSVDAKRPKQQHSKGLAKAHDIHDTPEEQEQQHQQEHDSNKKQRRRRRRSTATKK